MILIKSVHIVMQNYNQDMILKIIELIGNFILKNPGNNHHKAIKKNLTSAQITLIEKHCKL